MAVLLAAPSPAFAADGETCREQAAVAERAAGVPEGLLLAIGKRESGRYDPASGSVLPWPWAVNREGEGHLFETRQEAIAYAGDALRRGSTSIDVGCFQINLKYHPTAFASLEQAFDPAANASYAAQFLVGLHNREGNWETAVADYHSGVPQLGGPYRDAVLATWRGAPETHYSDRPVAQAPVRVAMGIRVWTGGMASYPLAVETAFTPGRGLRDLPRVITPSSPVTTGIGGDIRFGRRMVASLPR